VSDSVVIAADPATIEISQETTSVAVSVATDETVVVRHEGLIPVEVEGGGASLSISNPEQIEISVLGADMVEVEIVDAAITVSVGYAVGIGGGGGTGTGTDKHLVRWLGTTSTQDSTAILSDIGKLSGLISVEGMGVGAAGFKIGQEFFPTFADYTAIWLGTVPPFTDANYAIYGGGARGDIGVRFEQGTDSGFYVIEDQTVVAGFLSAADGGGFVLYGNISGLTTLKGNSVGVNAVVYLPNSSGVLALVSQIPAPLVQNRLLGRGSTSGTGVAEPIVLGTNLTLNGIVLDAAGSPVFPQGTLAGRGAASGTGGAQTITLGTNLSMAGSVLNASGGGGSGTVTSVAVVPSNGITASVTSPTAAASIALGLGAITPASVAATGAVTGSNLSGTNTGDEVLVQGVLSGRGAASGTGIPQPITLGAGLTMAGTVLSAPTGGAGTVTSVSATGTQGVTANVANPTSTPAITIGLGAITPTSVASPGTVTGSNLSNTNTGDQLISATGDVTAPASATSLVTTIGPLRVATGMIQNAAVSLAKMASVATGTVFYRKTAGTGDPEVQTLATLKTDLGLANSNSGDLTLAGAGGYLSLAAQVLTRTLIDLAAATHVTGILAVVNGGNGNSTGTYDGGTP
jgi:hypothetical protein